MKIDDVVAIHLRLHEVPSIPDGTLDVLMVKIITDDGQVGIGEVTSQSYVCKAIIEAPPSAQRRHGMAHLLRGRDPLDVEDLWEYLYYETNRYGRRGAAIHTLSGIDIALWDLRGKILGQPVHELLGGAKRETVRAYSSLLFGERPEETAQLARDGLEQGLTAFKFGWGPFGKDPDNDVAHVRAAREAIGDEHELMVDAGHAFNVETALQRARLIEPYNVTWFEEPLSQDDRKGYSELCAKSPIPIAAGEGDVTRWDFEDLIERGVAVVQPDVAFCGGLTVCRQVSEMTAAAGRRVVPHCFSTGINLAASLHWISTVEDADLVEYCLRPSPLMRKLVANLPPLIDGRVPIPNGPGLGIEIDQDIVDEFTVKY